MLSVTWFFLILLAYLLGSIPFGLVIAKLFCGIDPRSGGSKNVGATNVARLCGKKWGFLTLLCDLTKGIFAIFFTKWVASKLGTPIEYLFLFSGFAVIFGHIYPIFLHFKGGKGVATTVGVYLALVPIPFLIAGLLCLLVIWRTGYVSAGSLVLVGTLPLLSAIFGNLPVAILAVSTGCLIVYAHRENIARLRKGVEKTWNPSKKN